MINVVKPLHIIVVSKYIKEHIVERNPVNTTNVAKHFYISVVSKYIKEHTNRRQTI